MERAQDSLLSTTTHAALRSRVIRSSADGKFTDLLRRQLSVDCFQLQALLPHKARHPTRTRPGCCTGTISRRHDAVAHSSTIPHLRYNLWGGISCSSPQQSSAGNTRGQSPHIFARIAKSDGFTHQTLTLHTPDIFACIGMLLGSLHLHGFCKTTFIGQPWGGGTLVVANSSVG